ncbi:MAG: anti-sigma factor antagonist [Corallococcus sp.]|nr:anti-sigma factor antagonist [Corallococcus sp.]
MEIAYSVEGKNLIIKLIGELDEHAAVSARNKIDNLLERNYNAIIFDMSRLSFMDSTGIGVMIGRYKIIKQKGAVAYVRAPSATVDKIFKMSGLYEIMTKIS